jgi:hypothetical protein
MRSLAQWIIGLAITLAGAWVLAWGLGGTGYQSIPSLFAGSSLALSFLVLIAGLALLGAGAWVINKGHNETYAGSMAAAASLALVLLQKPGLDTWLKSIVRPDHTVFFRLAFESLLWQAGVILIFILAADAPKPWSPHVRSAVNMANFGILDVTQVRLNRWTSRTWASAGLALVVFLICSWSLVRAPGPAQAIWGSALAAFIASTIARVNFPSRNPLPLFFIPALIGPIVYLYAGLSITGESSLLSAWYTNSLPGLANALPAHLAAGSLMGFLAGCLLVNKANEYEAEAAAT